MDENANFFPKLKALYKKISRFGFIAIPLKKSVEGGVSLLARMRKISFPEKFTWEWKLEMLLGRYEKNTTDMCRNILKPGMIALDVGAHIGYYTILFSKLVGPHGKVIAFEADKDNFELLKKNTAHLNNVLCLNVAVSDKEGAIDFYKVNSSTGCHSIIPTEASRKITVDSTTLDKAMSDLRKNINLVKVDVEGAEPQVFAGMKNILEKTPHIALVSELNPDALRLAGTDPENFLKTMKNYGFEVYSIHQKGKKEIIDSSVNNIHFYKAKHSYTNLLFQK